MLKRKLLSSLVLIALVSGCDIDDDNEDTPRSLVGLWSSSCIADDSVPDYGTSYNFSFEFTETEVIIKSNYYDDLVCENAYSEYTSYGEYSTGELVTTPTGVDATELDITLRERTIYFQGELLEQYEYAEGEDESIFSQLFIIEDTYLYLGRVVEDGARPEDINYSFSLELQE